MTHRLCVIGGPVGRRQYDQRPLNQTGWSVRAGKRPKTCRRTEVDRRKFRQPGSVAKLRFAQSTGVGSVWAKHQCSRAMSGLQPTRLPKLPVCFCRLCLGTQRRITQGGDRLSAAAHGAAGSRRPQPRHERSSRGGKRRHPPQRGRVRRAQCVSAHPHQRCGLDCGAAADGPFSPDWRRFPFSAVSLRPSEKGFQRRSKAFPNGSPRAGGEKRRRAAGRSCGEGFDRPR